MAGTDKSIPTEKAIELYMHVTEKSDSLLIKAVIASIVCLGIKLLDVQISEIDLPGVKLSFPISLRRDGPKRPTAKTI